MCVCAWGGVTLPSTVCMFKQKIYLGFKTKNILAVGNGALYLHTCTMYILILNKVIHLLLGILLFGCLLIDPRNKHEL